MTVKETYEAMGADYQVVEAKNLPDEHVMKYLKMIPVDTSYKDFLKAIEKDDYKKAYALVVDANRIASYLGMKNITGILDKLQSELSKSEVDKDDIHGLTMELIDRFSHTLRIIEKA